MRFRVVSHKISIPVAISISLHDICCFCLLHVVHADDSVVEVSQTFSQVPIEIVALGCLICNKAQSFIVVQFGFSLEVSSSVIAMIAEHSHNGQRLKVRHLDAKLCEVGRSAICLIYLLSLCVFDAHYFSTKPVRNARLKLMKFWYTKSNPPRSAVNSTDKIK